MTLPVDNEQQYQHIFLNLTANDSAGSSTYDESLPITGCNYKDDIADVDLVMPPSLTSGGHLSTNLWGGKGCSVDGGVRTNTTFGYTVVPAGTKAPTYLWVPDDNSTLSSLPVGLQRYTGKQAFFLVVTNLSGNISVSRTRDSLPYGWSNGTKSEYSVTLSPGLNNFLIPRSRFLNSTLGRAMFLGETLPDPSGTAVLGTQVNIYTTSYGSTVRGGGSGAGDRLPGPPEGMAESPRVIHSTEHRLRNGHVVGRTTFCGDGCFRSMRNAFASSPPSIFETSRCGSGTGTSTT